MRKVLVLANPTAGAGAGRINKARVMEAAQRELARGFEVEIATAPDSSGISDLAAQGVRDDFDAIIAAGGDGTINAVVNGMMRDFAPPIFDFSALPQRATSTRTTRKNAAPPNPLKELGEELSGSLPALGLLPMGTGNVFAFNLGIRAEVRASCRVVRRFQTRRIDLGLARCESASRYFLLMAGVGFDAKVVEETSLRLKFVLRDFAYVVKTLQNVVLHQGSQMKLQMAGAGEHADNAWLAIIGNAASYAWDIRVTSQAKLDDGVLDVCLMPFENKLVSIRQAMQILTGQHLERGTARYWKTPALRLQREPPVPVQLDGDEWGATPIEVGVIPGALRVLAPSESD